MNDQLSINNRTLNYKVPIILLSLISLVISVITFKDYYYGLDNIFVIAITYIYTVAPCLLLLIYILKFHKKFKANVIIPIIFGLIAIRPIFHFVLYPNGSFTNLLIDNIIFITVFVALTIIALNGFEKKIAFIIAIAIALIQKCIILFKLILNLHILWRYDDHRIVIVLLLYNLGNIVFDIALLLFGLKNRIPPIISTFKTSFEKRTKGMSSEQILIYLKEECELGLMTEEEYIKHRDEVIKNL